MPGETKSSELRLGANAGGTLRGSCRQEVQIGTGPDIACSAGGGHADCLHKAAQRGTVPWAYFVVTAAGRGLPLFLVALAPMRAGEVWIDGQYSKLPAASVGDTFVFNLAVNTIARLNPPYDFLRFYMSSATLDQLAYDGGRRPRGRRAAHGPQSEPRIP